MSKLTLMVGAPGSGKTTYAHQLPPCRYVNQDSQGRQHLDYFNSFIANGENIVVDRMGFNLSQRDRYLRPAKEKGYETEIVVLHEAYDTCFARVMARKDHETIKDEQSARSALNTFFTKYERVQDSEADKVTRMWPSGEKPKAVIIDLDGTMCNVDHRLHFVRKVEGKRADWKSFFAGIPGDSVNQWCADIAHSLKDKYQIVYCSGRPDSNGRTTVDWLKEKDLWSLCNENLYMRPRGDHREDSIVKEIILDFEILTRAEPAFAIDDRARVVDMWRRRGITTLACADGDF